MAFYDTLVADVTNALVGIRTKLPVVALLFGKNSSGAPAPLEVSSAGLKVDASGALPVGAATAAAQTDGTQKAIARGAAKGTSVAADATASKGAANEQSLDVWNNAPGAVAANYGTMFLDASALRTTDETVTLTMTSGVTVPTTGQLVRVRVITTTTARPLEWVQGVNATLTIAANVVTVKALDGTTITVPAAATVVDVLWCGPSKALAQEDSASADKMFVVKSGRVRRDTIVSSAGSTGDIATANQDGDGFDPVVSKSRDSAQNAERVGEVSPIWNRYDAPFSIVDEATLVKSDSVRYYPAATGLALAGYADLALDLTMTAGAAASPLSAWVELSDDPTFPDSTAVPTSPRNVLYAASIVNSSTPSGNQSVSVTAGAKGVFLIDLDNGATYAYARLCVLGPVANANDSGAVKCWARRKY